MYHALIVDDELPALRFVRSIIEQFASGFQVVGTATSGEQGLELLGREKIDLLITDISMHGISGLELAQQARRIQPGIHIIIISGYGEFEYAQGAIAVGVDEYLLKPVSITKMTTLLQSVRQKLDEEQAELTASLLPAISCGLPHSRDMAAKLYGNRSFRLAYLRWGNLDMTLPRHLSATSIVLPRSEPFIALRGRDDDERILIAEDRGMDAFLADLSVYMTSPGSMATWTAVFTPDTWSIESLPTFIERAIELVYERTVIGTHQILRYTGGVATPHTARLPAADIKQLSYFITSGKLRMVKDYFLSLASTWEKQQTPQREVWHTARHLVHQVALVHPAAASRLEDILLELNDIIRCASCCGELMGSLYSLLFEGNNLRSRKLSTQELYDYAVAYISENYAQPLSTQSICDEIGISQTYLSRLFRKYSDTTINAFLTKCRMEAAMKLLREKPNLLLRDVAACVGYEDSSYFTKVFHQYTGKTPSQWTAVE
ncbi:MAG: response regulator [Candidatus Ventricola sp.]